MGLKVGGSSVQSTEQSRLQMNQDKRRGVGSPWEPARLPSVTSLGQPFYLFLKSFAFRYMSHKE